MSHWPKIHLSTTAGTAMPQRVRAYPGRAMCGAGREWRTEDAQQVSDDLQDVTCGNCRRTRLVTGRNLK